MSGSMNSLGGETTVPVVNNWIWVLSGFVNGDVIRIRTRTSDAVDGLGNYLSPNDGSIFATATANACGVAIVAGADVLTTSYDQRLYLNTLSAAKSITGQPPASNSFQSWVYGVTSPFLAHAYVTAGSSLIATPAGSSVGLAWGAASTVSIFGSLVYRIWRTSNGATPSEGVGTLVTTTSSTSYTDTGLTTGVTYKYRVRACIDLGCSLYTGDDNVGAANYSNTVTTSVTGVSLRELWGAIAL